MANAISVNLACLDVCSAKIRNNVIVANSDTIYRTILVLHALILMAVHFVQIETHAQAVN